VLDSGDVLPALSLVYSLTPATNLRFSASQTLNRPEYRELAPFKYTHVVGGFAVTGNPSLQQAEIVSFDARWEWFPAGGEVVAASIFYKDFTDPIESVVITGAELVESYENVDSAENLGAELEFRRNLAIVSESLSHFDLIANYTWVDSQVTIDDAQTAGTNLERPLVGQPDNVLNLILDWTRPQSDTGMRLLYNFVDDKIAFAGFFGLPDVVEEARSSLDFTFTQGLGFLGGHSLHGLSLKFSLTNLLDEERNWTQGGQTYRLYQPGIGTSLSIGYSFL
jgi:outer membrane receptor protein involved in Fe transport